MHTISEAGRKAAQKIYLTFSSFNGISIALVADSMVILYAVQLGVPPSSIGAMGSFIFLSMPFMLIGKYLTSRFGAPKTASFAWGLRSLFPLLLIPLPFLMAKLSFSLGVAVLLTIMFAFWASRSTGMIVMSPIVGEITDNSDRQHFNSMNFALYCSFHLATTLLAIIALYFMRSTLTFQILIALGCLAGFCSSYCCSKFPESENARKSAASPVFCAFSRLWNDHKLRKLIAAWATGWGAAAFIVPFSMLALKKGYGIPDFQAMIFALIQMGGSAVFTSAAGRISARTGARSMIIFCFSMYLLVCLMWAFAPDFFSPVYTAVIFFLAGGSFMAAELAILYYFLNVVPKENMVADNLIGNMIAGTSAGLAGTFAGAGILKLLEIHSLDMLSLFRNYFSVIFVILLCLMTFILKLEKISSRSAGKIVFNIISGSISPVIFVSLISRLDSLIRRSKSEAEED